MKKTKHRLYKKRRRTKRKGGAIDAKVGPPLFISDSVKYVSDSFSSIKNNLMGNYP
jgi:hypothetical protein